MLEFASGASRQARVLVVLLVAAFLPGCATGFYVDNTLHELTTEEKVKVENPQPVQLLFEFQTKGAPNGRATDMLKEDVRKTVQDSGLFSAVGSEPVPNGAVVNVVLNNVPLTDDAYAKGFATGLTLGLAGTTVGDGYICTVDYLPGGRAPKVSKSLRDALYTSVGANAEKPQNAAKMSNATDAIKLIARKVVGNTLNDVAKDPGFAPTASTP
jgi:hypothetical protein